VGSKVKVTENIFQKMVKTAEVTQRRFGVNFYLQLQCNLRKVFEHKTKSYGQGRIGLKKLPGGIRILRDPSPPLPPPYSPFAFALLPVGQSAPAYGFVFKSC